MLVTITALLLDFSAHLLMQLKFEYMSLYNNYVLSQNT